jgi:hypothetical protein
MSPGPATNRPPNAKQAKWDALLASLLDADVTFEDAGQVERYLRRWPGALAATEQATLLVRSQFPPPAQVVLAVDTDPEIADPCLLLIVRTAEATRTKDGAWFLAGRLSALRKLKPFRVKGCPVYLTTDHARPGSSLGSIQQVRG